MITVNLFQQGEVRAVAERTPRKGSHPLVLALLGFVFAIAVAYVLLAEYPLGGLLGTKAPTQTASASQGNPVVIPKVEPTVVALPVDDAVEEVVKTLKPEQQPRTAAQAYERLLPVERVYYQKVLVKTVFDAVQGATPPGVGYAEIAVHAPDGLLLRGVAPDEKTSKALTASFATIASDMKADSVAQKSGAFSLYARLKPPPPGGVSEAGNFVPSKSVSSEFAKVKELGKAYGVSFSGLERTSATPFGLYRRVSAKAVTNADFPTLQAFLKAFAASDVRVGILQLGSRATQSGAMGTTIEFVVYSDPG